jgi:uncharacterized membrane protein
MNQLLITVFLAMVLGAVLCMLGKYILSQITKYYYKLTFKHEVLEPYTPNTVKKDKK